MGRLLRTVPADCHGAPTAGTTSRVIGEDERTGRSFAGLHLRKVLRADEPSQGLADRQEKRVGLTPAAHGLQLEAILFRFPRGNPPEGLVALEQAIEQFQLGEVLRRQRASHSLMQEATEPLS